jgi:hypothetical protein
MKSGARIGHDARNEGICIVLRMLIAGALLLPLAVVYGEALVGTWLEAYRVVFSWVADDFKLLSLYIDQEGADRVLRARVMWEHLVVIGGKVLYPDPRGTANASTQLAHALQGPMVALLTVIAWPHPTDHAEGKPVRLWIEWAIRACALIPLLAVLVLIDMPVVLAGELWDLVLSELDPGSTKALVIWKTFMQGGGRYALGLVGGCLAVLAARHLCRFVDKRFPPGSLTTSLPEESSTMQKLS